MVVVAEVGLQLSLEPCDLGSEVAGEGRLPPFLQDRSLHSLHDRLRRIGLWTPGVDEDVLGAKLPTRALELV